MQHGDHRHRQFSPAPAHLLEQVGFFDAVLGEPLEYFQRLGHHRGEIQAGAEGLALTLHDDHTQAAVLPDCLCGVDQSLHHVEIQTVVLLGPVEGDVGNIVFLFQGDAIAEGLSHGVSLWSDVGHLFSDVRRAID